MDPDLLKAYSNTNYLVHDPPMSIRIGEMNGDVQSLLEQEKQSEWAFITPYNPFSKVLSNEENEKRFETFHNKLNNYKCYAGEGVGENPSWCPEKSLLILGISKSEAIKIGKEFEQNAIVYGRKNEKPELILLS